MCEKPWRGHGPTGSCAPGGDLLLVKDEEAEGARAVAAICPRQVDMPYGGQSIRWVSHREGRFSIRDILTLLMQFETGHLKLHSPHI